MANRSPFTRRLRAAIALVCCAGLMPLLVAGCQNYGQYDLAARELRMQEDQLYAMEAYMEQYQQLICKYREENARLHRQVADGYYDETMPSPSQPDRERSSTPATRPPAPRPNGTRPPQQLEVPDVPPLGETGFNEPSNGEAALASAESQRGADPITPAIVLGPAAASSAISEVWLHGEVVENDSGGGPRLVVEINPLAADGRAAPFDSPLSLMLLGPDGDGDQHSLARWDFTAQEVQTAIDTAAGHHTIRFQLELPPDIPVNDAIQLWVRLLPRGAKKVLAHADLSLAQSGAFSSLAQPPASLLVPEERSATALALNPPSNPLRQVHTGLAGSGWSTAKPGEPAALDSDGSNAQWRASSEVIPTVIATSSSARHSPAVDRSTSRRQVVQPLVMTAQPPSWTPDRAGGKSQELPRTASASARPRWSPTR